jgi:sugar phosphate isomerase/epimerase
VNDVVRDRGLTRRSFLGRAAAAGAAAAGAGLPACRAGGQAGDAAAGSPWTIGIYTRPWDQHELPVILDAIAEAGFRHAGLMTVKSKSRLVISAATTPEEAARTAEELRKRGLAVPSVYGGDIAVAKGLQAGIDDLRRLIDRCAAVGAKDLMMGGLGDAKLQADYYKAVAECCGYAAEKGMGLSVKPHGGLNATGAQCRDIVRSVGKRNFGVWYDPGNILFYSDGKRDPVADAADVDGLVVGMSVKDFLPPKNVAVTPGTGRVDFPAVMKRLKQGGFAGGPLVIECLAPGDLPQLLAEAKKARRFLEDVAARL